RTWRLQYRLWRPSVPGATLARQLDLNFAPTRAAVLARYHGLREISKAHHAECLRFLSQGAIIRAARRIGLTVGRHLVCEADEEFSLVMDLAIHTAETGRSRAIDRYAGSGHVPAGSEAAAVLDAMCRSRFTILSIERRHEAAGLVMTDLCDNGEREIWL